MGLFGVNYAKEGPGVEKNAPQKKRFFLFWDIYFRKFWKIIQLNLLYVLFYIPAAVGAYYLLFGGMNVFSVLMILISVVLSGPATAGMTYVLRNFAREEHAFVFSDFFDNFKSNFKQAAVYGVLFTVFAALMCVSIRFYYLGSQQNTMMFIPLVLCLACTMVGLFMNFYMYTMIVTFAMPLIQMVKNAFIFSVVGLFTNLLTLVITGAIAVAMFLFFPITILFIATIALSTSQFIVTFNVYPKIKKFMIDPFRKEEEPSEAENADEAIFSDERLIPPSEDDER